MQHALALGAACLAALSVAGCISLQGGYDHAARSECHKLVDASERQACLNGVDKNSREKRLD